MRENPPRPLDRNLDQWPFPDRESLPIDFVESMPLDVPVVLSRERFTTMQTSRGCPWPCIFCDIPIFNEGKWRSRSPEHVLAEFEQLKKDGYGAVYFVDDHFLLQPKRIEAICKGINERGLEIQWGCEGRVDSVCMDLFPAMAKAHCRTLMFGIESGSQKILDRLKKEQTLEQTAIAVRAAKKAGIEIVHGFFVVGNPDETEEDMCDTFRFAERLPLDTFAFNRLCVYRGTPLWKEYVERGLVERRRRLVQVLQVLVHRPDRAPRREDPRDSLPRAQALIIYKFLHFPMQALRLTARLVRNMPWRNVRPRLREAVPRKDERADERRGPLARRRA